MIKLAAAIVGGIGIMASVVPLAAGNKLLGTVCGLFSFVLVVYGLSGLDDERVRIKYMTPEETRFAQLAAQWKEETALHSSVGRMIEHPCYQQIIAMGEPAVRMMLRDFQSGNDEHWFYALAEITKENPAQQVRTVEAAMEAWVRWGKERGYLPTEVSHG